MSLLELHPNELVGRTFEWSDLSVPGGRIQMWEPPNPRRRYVAGSDCALGSGHDLDTLCIADATEHPVRQVFEAAGQWGPAFDRVLYACLMFYFEPYTVIERQVGYVHLRRLWDDYGYTNLYRERDPTGTAQKLTRKLGYFRPAHDMTLPSFRSAVLDRKYIIRSWATIRQMQRLQFKARDTIEVHEIRDSDLRVKLAGGGSPDLVMAATYSWFASLEGPWDPPPPPKPDPRSYGVMLEHRDFDSDLEPTQPEDYQANTEPYRRRKSGRRR